MRVSIISDYAVTLKVFVCFGKEEN